MDSKRELCACPCCGHLTLESAEDYEICPICYWEDDGDQLVDADADDDGGANFELTLRQARRNFQTFGACGRDMLDHVRKPTPEDEKDPEWRPIRDDDVFLSSFPPGEQKQLIEAKDWSDCTDVYYWKPNYWLRKEEAGEDTRRQAASNVLPLIPVA